MQCPCLLAKIDELKKELLHSSTAHSILVQKLEQQNILLGKTTSDATKKLKEVEKQNIRLKDILDEMKSRNYISDSERDFLNVSIYTGSRILIISFLIDFILCPKVFEMREVVECLCKGIKGHESYPPSVRAFCMSLHYTSPRTYDFLREKFGKHLPHA